MTFNDLNLIEPILRALSEEGYTTPTPIQQQAIPQVLEGHDLLGVAQTGTGKTAAFSVPILQILHQTAQTQKAAQGPRGRVRCLVLTPTRELAIQIGESFKAYGRHLPQLRSTVIFGGVGQNPQVQALQRGVEILVATPGRLLDLMNQGYVNLQHLEVFVLDEADRMLDMGFIHDIKRILPKLPAGRQSLFFSATMPNVIKELSATILRPNPVQVAVTPVSSTADTVTQSVFLVDKNDKPALLRHVLKDPAIKRVLVFTRTKHGANKVTETLEKAQITAEAIHGNKSQNHRQRALSNFKAGTTRVLVATDIAARGIDINELPKVINYDLPMVPEDYVHRIGRTGRNGSTGEAVSLVAQDEAKLLRQIVRLLNRDMDIRDVPGFEPQTPIRWGNSAPGKAEHPGGHKAPRRGNSAGHGPRRPGGDAPRGGRGGQQKPGGQRNGGNGQQRRDAHPGGGQRRGGGGRGQSRTSA